jgi:hypothetical protein
MYEAAFNNIDKTLRQDAGCGTELDYIEQTSWILFLKYLDDYEADDVAILGWTVVACKYWVNSVFMRVSRLYWTLI